MRSVRSLVRAAASPASLARVRVGSRMGVVCELQARAGRMCSSTTQPFDVQAAVQRFVKATGGDSESARAYIDSLPAWKQQELDALMTRRITAASGESTGLSGVENSVEIPAKAAQDVIGRVTPESELLDLDASHSVPGGGDVLQRTHRVAEYDLDSMPVWSKTALMQAIPDDILRVMNGMDEVPDDHSSRSLDRRLRKVLRERLQALKDVVRDRNGYTVEDRCDAREEALRMQRIFGPLAFSHAAMTLDEDDEDTVQIESDTTLSRVWPGQYPKYLKDDMEATLEAIRDLMHKGGPQFGEARERPTDAVFRFKYHEELVPGMMTPMKGTGKVVVDFKVDDLKLEPVVAERFVALCGPRCKDGRVIMASDRHPLQVDNKAQLKQWLQELYKEAHNVNEKSG